MDALKALICKPEMNEKPFHIWRGALKGPVYWGWRKYAKKIVPSITEEKKLIIIVASNNNWELDRELGVGGAFQILEEISLIPISIFQLPSLYHQLVYT